MRLKNKTFGGANLSKIISPMPLRASESGKPFWLPLPIPLHHPSMAQE